MPAPTPTPLTEGERWTRERLVELLSARFAPRAIGRFFLDSQRRANLVRGRRPDLAHQSRVCIGSGAALWAALALAGVEPYRERLREGLAWWALTGVMLDWHLGMFETPGGSPRPIGVADGLTLARVWLAPVALEDPRALVLAVGFATDVLDGQAARRLAQPTRAGRDLEGLADLCFAGAVLVGLRRRDRVGRAASAAELARLGAGLAYALLVYFGRAERPGESGHPRGAPDDARAGGRPDRRGGGAPPGRHDSGRRRLRRRPDAARKPCKFRNAYDTIHAQNGKTCARRLVSL